jgi:hypothetical protein
MICRTHFVRIIKHAVAGGNLPLCPTMIGGAMLTPSQVRRSPSKVVRVYHSTTFGWQVLSARVLLLYLLVHCGCGYLGRSVRVWLHWVCLRILASTLPSLGSAHQWGYCPPGPKAMLLRLALH